MKFKYIITAIVLVIAIVGGYFAWQYFDKSGGAINEPEGMVEDETIDWKTYTNEEYGFEINVPSTMEISPYETNSYYDEPVLFVVSFKDSHGAPFVLVIKENTENTINEWVIKTVCCNIEEEIFETELGGFSAIRWKSGMVPLDRYFVAKDGKVYEFWPTENTALTDNEVNEIFSIIISTFKFTN